LLFAGLILFYVAYMVLLVKNRNFSQIVYVLFAIAYIFLLKKQATVRADMQHLSEFVICAPLVLIFGNLLYYRDRIQRIALAITLVLVLFALFINTSLLRIDSAFANRFTNKMEYLRQFINNKDDYLNDAGKRYIPDTLLKK